MSKVMQDLGNTFKFLKIGMLYYSSGGVVGLILSVAEFRGPNIPEGPELTVRRS